MAVHGCLLLDPELGRRVRPLHLRWRPRNIWRWSRVCLEGGRALSRDSRTGGSSWGGRPDEPHARGLPTKRGRSRTCSWARFVRIRAVKGGRWSWSKAVGVPEPPVGGKPRAGRTWPEHGTVLREGWGRGASLGVLLSRASGGFLACPSLRGSAARPGQPWRAFAPRLPHCAQTGLRTQISAPSLLVTPGPHCGST